MSTDQRYGPNTAEKQMACEWCAGTGRQEWTWLDWETGLEGREVVACERCGGLGHAPRSPEWEEVEGWLE